MAIANFLLSVVKSPFGWSKRAKIDKAIAAADEARDGRSWERAAAAYKAALALDAKLAPIWVQFGHALKESGRIGDAEMAYRRAIEIDPLDPDAHVQLGHALKVRGLLADAKASYFAAIQLRPDFEAARVELANLAVSAEELRALLQQAHEAPPPSSPKRVVIVYEVSFEQLPLEIQALLLPRPDERILSVAFARFSATDEHLHQHGSTEELRLNDDDLIVSVHVPSSALLRLIRFAMHATSTRYAPIVAQWPRNDGHAQGAAVGGDFQGFFDALDHAAYVIAPSPVLAAELELTLRRLERSYLGVRAVTFDGLPEWTEKAPADLIAASREMGSEVIADLRGDNFQDLGIIRDAWKQVVADLEQVAKLVLLVDDPKVASFPNEEVVARISNVQLAARLRSAKCLVVLRGNEGWASSAMLALSQKCLPLVGEGLSEMHTLSGLAEVCTQSVHGLGQQLRRVLTDESYLRDRRAVIAARPFFRPGAEVLASLARPTPADVGLAHHLRKITLRGLPLLSLGVPYTFGNRAHGFKKVPFGRGINFLVKGGWKVRDELVFLHGGVAYLRMAYFAEKNEAQTIWLLCDVEGDAKATIASPQHNKTMAITQGGTQWLQLEVWPSMNDGTIELAVSCEDRSSDGGIALRMLYATPSSGPEMSSGFLETLSRISRTRSQ